MPAKKQSDDEELDLDIEMPDDEQDEEIAPPPKKLTKKPAPIKIAVTNWEDEVEVDSSQDSPVDEADDDAQDEAPAEPEIIEEETKPSTKIKITSFDDELPAYDEIEEDEDLPIAEDEKLVDEAPKQPAKKIAVFIDDEEESADESVDVEVDADDGDEADDDGEEWHKIGEEEPAEEEADWSQAEDEVVPGEDGQTPDDGVVEEDATEDEEVQEGDNTEGEDVVEEEPVAEDADEDEPEEVADVSGEDAPLDPTKTIAELTSDDGHESDEDLIVSEMHAQEAAAAAAKKTSTFAKLRGLLKKWWQAPKIRRTILGVFGLTLLALAFIPTTRFAFLNSVGVRASAELTVVDSKTNLPLKNVEVLLSGTSGMTNDNGVVTLNSVRLGKQTVTVQKLAYADYSESISISMGNNKLKAVGLTATGTSFKITLLDWLSEAPIGGGEVSYGENSVLTDENGVATLVIPPVDEDKITVSAVADGYAKSEFAILTTSEEETQAKLVLDRANYFISKRNGTYDVYKIGADGQNEELLLEGTGNEKAGLRFDVSPSGSKAVLVATRDKNVKNEDGFILSGLYEIDTTTKELKKRDSSESLDLVGWIGDSLIYVKINAGASGQNPERHRLMSFNTATGETRQIAASNYFNDILVAGDYVFYAPSDAYKKAPKAHLFRSNAGGTDIQTVLNKNVWTILRTGLDEIIFDAQQKWYRGKVNSITNSELDTKPTDYVSRLYTDSPDGSKSAWVDSRDGKGVLIVADAKTGKETRITSQSGLRNPITWLSENHLVFRVVTSSETADYVITLDGKKVAKIVDVTDVSGADRWYYYY